MTEIKQRDWAIKEASEFFRTRRSILLNQYAMAKFSKDREGMKDAKEAIKNYNDTVPHSSLRITNLAKSLRQKKKNQMQAERGLGRGKRGVPQAKALNELYPIEEENVR